MSTPEIRATSSETTVTAAPSGTPAAASDGPLVVVGVADTAENDAAVRWGAEHARRSGGRLHLVHAFVWPLMNVDVDPVPGIAGSGLRAGAESLIRHAEEVARAASPEVPVTSEIVDGRAADVLLQSSHRADVLAVGSRGLGRFLAMVMGSTSLALGRRAACPVVVVRGDEATDGPVGVAYEGSDLGARAIRRAGELAALYGTHAALVVGVATPRDQNQRILETARGLVAETHPEVEVHLADPTAAHDARRLVELTKGARMLVVPARTEGAASASSHISSVVQYAQTPIWIERAAAAE